MKRSRLQRKTRLVAKTGIKRSNQTGKARRRVDTGPSRKTRDLVKKTRANGCCERCGHRGGHIHHRDPRGMGGTSRPGANLPSNLVFLCPECHADVESNRLQAIGDGWLIPDGLHPPDVPVLLYYGRHKLTDDGGTIPIPDPCPAGCSVWNSNDPDDCEEMP